MMAVAHPTVMFVNVCSKKGVQFGLLLLQLVIESLYRGLCWLVLLHCKVVRLAAHLKAFAFGGIGRQVDGFDVWLAGGLAFRIIGGFDGGLQVGLLVGTLGTGGCGCMERVILLLSLIWVVGTLVKM